MHRGSCLCGVVKYEVRGELGGSIFCHCSRCRKASGSAFASNAAVALQDFAFTEGETALTTFSTAEGVHRLFCSRCGSPIITRRDAFPDSVRLRLGTLDSPLRTGPQLHVFVGSKADWYEIHDEFPQHAERP
jgi:hypothetical protein